MRLGSAILAVTGCLLLAGPSFAVDPPGRYVKVLVSTNGGMQVDGSVADVAKMDAAFQSAAANHQVVMYFRENPKQDPPPAEAHAANAVIGLVVKHRLPICFALDASFSGCMGADR